MLFSCLRIFPIVVDLSSSIIWHCAISSQQMWYPHTRSDRNGEFKWWSAWFHLVINHRLLTHKDPHTPLLFFPIDLKGNMLVHLAWSTPSKNRLEKCFFFKAKCTLGFWNHTTVFILYKCRCETWNLHVKFSFLKGGRVFWDTIENLERICLGLIIGRQEEWSPIGIHNLRNDTVINTFHIPIWVAYKLISFYITTLHYFEVKCFSTCFQRLLML